MLASHAFLHMGNFLSLKDNRALILLRYFIDIWESAYQINKFDLWQSMISSLKEGMVY